MREWLTYSTIYDLIMTCYEIVFKSKWTAKLFSDQNCQNGLLWQLTYLAICNFKIACYDIVVYSKWMIDLISDL